MKTHKIIFTKFQLLLCISWTQIRVEVQLHSFLTTALNGRRGGWWVVRFMTRPLFPYGNSPQVLFEYEAGYVERLWRNVITIHILDVMVKDGSVFVTLLIPSAVWCPHFSVGPIWIRVLKVISKTNFLSIDCKIRICSCYEYYVWRMYSAWPSKKCGTHSSCLKRKRIKHTENLFQMRPTRCTLCYRRSWFEARSKICSAERQAQVREKNKVKFRTSSKRISLVCNILVYCEGVDFRVNGFKFMAVYHAKGCWMLLARVTTISPLCLPGNGTFYALFGIHQSDSCYGWLE